MPRNAPHRRPRSRTSCSVLALATVMAVGATPAAAQSLLGSGTYVTNPHVTGITTGPGTTTINLNGGQTVIDWTPTDNAVGTGTNINFQNSGTTALFTGSADFAVLNRVLPADFSRAIVMNGTVNARVGGSQRGSVYFYSPSGFIFGGTSVFSVGSLVVTASPITLTGSNFINGNTVVFGQALNPSAAIVSGGTINASSAPIGVIPPGQSYVAMVAPRVVHNGTITANGSTALVAAEAATINFSPDGLFDIQVTVGTTSSDGINVHGDIGGPTPTGASDQQGVYLVAVPKNDALTMVIGNGADLGFTLASTAVDENGVVVLSAGHDIIDGQIAGRSAGHGASATGNFWFTGAHATNNVFGEATGFAELYSVAGQPITTFDNDVTVHATEHVWMNASGVGTSLTVGGDLSLSTNAIGAAGQSATAGVVSLYAQNSGTVSVAGATTLSANATGGDASSGTAGSGTGGTVWINEDDGGSLSLAAVTATATGTGGNGLAAGVNAGQGTGGTLRVYGDDTGSVLINGALSLNGQGTGGDASGAGLAGVGQGGRAYVYVGDDASVTINGSTTMVSDGQGGSHATGTGGTGRGGESRVTSVDPSTTGGLITFNGDVTLSSDGVGGTSGGAGAGGAGTGGWARMSTPDSHDVAVNGSAYLHAVGIGGGSSTGTGGAGQGGIAELVSLVGDIDISSTVTISSSGQGGSGALAGGGQGGSSTISSSTDISLPGNVYIYSLGDGGSAWNGDGGIGRGGTVVVEADGGSLAMGSLYTDARGRGGYADTGFTSGNGHGGDIIINAYANSSLTVTNWLDAYADGIGGETPWLGVNGGNGFGGYIELDAEGTNASLTVGGHTNLNANGEAGYASECSICGGLGGQGIGGEIFVTANGTNAILTLSSVSAYADGYGGLGVNSGGGYGEGGFIQFSASNDGTLNVTDSLYASADGHGGDSTEDGYGADGDLIGGDGVGGTVEMLTFGSGNPRISIGSWAEIQANGYGGDVFSSLFLFQEGGQATAAEGDIRGGDGTGGLAGIYANAGRISDDGDPDNDGGITIGGSAYVSGEGFGGDTGDGYGGGLSGGIGGDGYGRNAEIFANGGDIDIGGWAYVSADGSGGYGDFGGDGIGGGTIDPLTSDMIDGAHLMAKNGTLTLGGASLSSNGYGADGGNGYYYGGGTGGSGGDGTGGLATVWAANSDSGPSLIYVSDVESSLNVSADGYGGDGDSGYDGLNGLDGLGGAGGGVGEPGENGTDGQAGGAGGAGGNGTGGTASAFAGAGNGELDILSVYMSASGFGGDGGDGGAGGFGGWGGDGGNGDAGAGGDGGSGGNGGAGGLGGAGGSAVGGRVTIGTASGTAEATAENLGLSTFGFAYIEASATGGNGGNGGTFGSGGNGGQPGIGDPTGLAGANGSDGAAGNGGNGGNANGGAATILVRGSTVNILGSASLVANAFGGDGGFGAGDFGVQGIGGDATVGGEVLGLGILVTPRHLIPAQTGMLTAGSITGSAVATEGSGSFDGLSSSLGESGVFFINSAGNIGSLDFTIDADGVGPGAFADMISLVGSNNLTAGSFSFSTVGDLSLLVDNGQFIVGTLTLDAGNFVHDGATPTNLGTTFADDVFVTTDNDFIADTNWNVLNTFNVFAPGSIEVDNVRDDNGINFFAGGSIVTGDLNAGTFVELFAYDFISTGDVDAGSSVDIEAYFGSVDVGIIDAGTNVALRAGTYIAGEDIFAGGNVFARSYGGDTVLDDIDAGGNIELYSSEDILIGGTIDAGGSFTSLATGLFDANDITAGGFISIGTGGGINADHLVAGGDIDLGSDGAISILTALAGETINIETSSSLQAGSLTAGDSVLGQAMGMINVGTVSAGLVNPSTADGAEYRASFASDTGIVTGDVSAAGNIGFGTPGNLSTGNLDSGGGIMALVGGSILLPTVHADGYVFLADHSMSVLGGDFETFDRSAVLAAEPVLTGGPINITGPLTAGSFVTAAAGTNLSYVTIQAGGNVDLRAGNDINGGAITSFSGGISLDAGGDIFLNGDALADGDIELSADGDILMANATSRQSIEISGGGYVDGDNLTAGDSIDVEAAEWVMLGNLSAGIINPSSNPDADYVAAIHAGGNIQTGDIEAAQHVGLATPGTMTTGDIDAGGIFMALGTGNMSFGDADAGSEVYLADYSMMALGGEITDEFDPLPVLAATPTPTGGSITIGDVNAGKFTAAAGTNLTTGIIGTGGGIGLGAGGAISTGDLFAGDFVLANGGSIATGDIEADSVDMTSTGGDIATGDILAFGAVALDAFGDIASGDIVATSIDLLAGDDIATGDLTTQFILLLDQEGSGTKSFLYPGASITLEAGDDIATGNIFSIDGVYANAGGSIATGWIFANDFVELFAVDDISSGYIDAGRYILADSGDDQSLGNLNAGWDIELIAGGDLAFGDANAGTEFDFEAGGNVAGGDVVAGVEIGGEGAGGNIVLGDLTAGFGEGEPEDTFSIGFAAGGSITVGDVNGAQRVGFAALGGNMTTGDIVAGWDIMLFVDGNLVTGAITNGEVHEVFIADASMCTGCGMGGETDLDPDAVLALDTVATGGSIVINDTVTTGRFRAAAGTSLTTQAITAADDIEASAGGTATLNGVWNSGDDVELASNDIDITASGGIRADDGVGLFSTNATQALIGDGLTGTGYALSNAEFGRISGYDVGIGARGDASAAIDMRIGDLTVTGPLVGSTIEGADGVLAFAVGDIDSETVSGVIRVNGDVAATGFGSGNAIEFYATRFELDAATGSVSIFSSGSTLGGELGLYADRIHVAEGSILDQLADNSTYSGYQQDLNDAATVQRPEGVLRASRLWIESDNLQDVLIQNTGTTATPAGFLVNEAFVNDDEEVAGPPGSINLVVNGQVATEGGTLTGIDARDALTEEADLTPFTTNSTINGCPLTGPCVVRVEQPDPPAQVVDDQIDLITGDPLGDSDFGNEPDIDDNEEGDEGADNPITPPQPLFDTRPLIPDSDVNDPVSGTGNPSLMGNDCDQETEAQCATVQEDGQ